MIYIAAVAAYFLIGLLLTFCLIWYDPDMFDPMDFDCLDPAGIIAFWPFALVFVIIAGICCLLNELVYAYTEALTHTAKKAKEHKEEKYK